MWLGEISRVILALHQQLFVQWYKWMNGTTDWFTLQLRARARAAGLLQLGRSGRRAYLLAVLDTAGHMESGKGARSMRSIGPLRWDRGGLVSEGVKPPARHQTEGHTSFIAEINPSFIASDSRELSLNCFKERRCLM